MMCLIIVLWKYNTLNRRKLKKTFFINQITSKKEKKRTEQTNKKQLFHWFKKSILTSRWKIQSLIETKCYKTRKTNTYKLHLLIKDFRRVLQEVSIHRNAEASMYISASFFSIHLSLRYLYKWIVFANVYHL